MVKSCCAYKCKETFIKGGPISFHRFPKNEKKREIWRKNLRRENFKATDSSLICSKHFTADCFDKNKFGGTWLKSDAVPTIFNSPQPLQIKTAPERRVLTCRNEENSVEPFKRIRYNGVFYEEVFDSASYAEEERKKKAIIIERISRVKRRLQMRIKIFEKAIHNLRQEILVSDQTEEFFESSGTAAREEDKKKEYNPLEPNIEIKEEPADYQPTPDTSTETDNEGFILPHEGTTWTPPVQQQAVEPQFTLSVASLAPKDPDASDGEQARKKRKVMPSTVNGFEERPQSPDYSFGESSDLGSFKEHRKDQFDVFGEYIAAKLRNLDRISCAFTQKAIGDIIFAAELGKYLDKISESRESKNSEN